MVWFWRKEQGLGTAALLSHLVKQQRFLVEEIFALKAAIADLTTAVDAAVTHLGKPAGIAPADVAAATADLAAATEKLKAATPAA